MHRGFAWLALATVSLLVGSAVEAGPPKVSLRSRPSVLQHAEGRVGPLLPTSPAASGGAQGSTIAADATGLWIAERNAGALIRTDLEGVVKATIPLHADLGELLLDGKGALLVADRRADRVLRFTIAGDVATPAGEVEVVEPFGLALAPDGASLLVTSVANHELVVLDPSSLALRWRVALLPEPRAVAISPDSKTALVGFLASGSLAFVDLASEGKAIRWHSLSPRDEVDIETDRDFEFTSHTIAEVEPASRFEVPNDVGRRHARNVFALRFVANGVAVAPHQISTPQMKLIPEAQRGDAYGGGIVEVDPAEYWQTRVALPGADGLIDMDQHRLHLHQPRALAYDAARDILYVGGYGDDAVDAIRNASLEAPTIDWTAELGSGPSCGLDGLALAGDALFVHCELSRSIIRISLDPATTTRLPTKAKTWLRSDALAPSLRDAKVEHGADLFRRGESFMLGNSLACSSCHPEGRNDALAWRLGSAIMQTPILAGRVADTAPYKWTGEDPTLTASFEHTVDRIGGDASSLTRRDLAGLEAYLLSLAPPRPPSGGDPAAQARGKQVFEAECSVCHAGARTTDREQHEFAIALAKVDTPSLIGLAQSAPYYHDGSAVDLDALLDDRGNVHDMIDSSSLSPDQRRDLIAYLESL